MQMKKELKVEKNLFKVLDQGQLHHEVKLQ